MPTRWGGTQGPAAVAAAVLVQPLRQLAPSQLAFTLATCAQVFVPKEDLSLDVIKQYRVYCPTPGACLMGWAAAQLQYGQIDQLASYLLLSSFRRQGQSATGHDISAGGC